MVQGLEMALILGLNPKVHQSVGMIAVQIGDSVEVAAMRLVAAADGRADSIDAIAAEVVARRTRFEP